MTSSRLITARGTACLIAVVAGAGVLLWGEAVHAAAARRARLLRDADLVGDVAIIVLGFRDAGGRANVVNRWRARIAVRTARRLSHAGREVRIVCSGGAVHGDISEARLLQRHIQETLAWDGAVLVEQESTSTWENVGNTLPMILSADWIIFASNGLHAEKAREYLRRQRPDLVNRLARADDYVPGELILLKPLFAAVGLRKLRNLREGSASRG